ncbi:MAG: hypothetical protein CBHOC_0536 [uncultured Caballeronia sp.]|nr:MAG: hypothetical protein CBHOC_0536 [uncultured Caballeronia sp.]
MKNTSRTKTGARLVRSLTLPVALVLAAGLGGCVYVPPYGYAPAPAYGLAYGYAYGPGYYAAPSVSLGIGFSSGGGHWHGH